MLVFINYLIEKCTVKHWKTFLGFINCTADCILRLTGVSIYVFAFNDYTSWIINYDTVLRMKRISLDTQKRIFPLTHRRGLTLTGSVRLTCAAAIHDRFLLSGARLLQFGLPLFFKEYLRLLRTICFSLSYIYPFHVAKYYSPLYV